ncbi:hypothetical protein CXG81DRAFT_24438 [Caulochytrium protostelioides]|uniref:Methyltransferase domain-containing protein n=1 Tax=Caulochytrium protostelioides TaxID=1555241 RepID=A0A4P9XCR7_9FUNG|nr:hypothetical protein CXG81DRAFT_24438 [Caulochytrium protostelioides]|eukprot:RKP02941.1 hypothetical protein CXG81DRAFT_24438 [Caulochytrium protostelioides]
MRRWPFWQSALPRLLPLLDPDPTHARRMVRWLLEAICSRDVLPRYPRAPPRAPGIPAVALAPAGFDDAADAAAVAAAIGRAATPHQQQRLLRGLEAMAFHAKPLPYVTREETFCGLALRCRPPILIPRWETAWAVATLADAWASYLAAAAAPPEPVALLDLCSGSGCMALGMAQSLQSHGVAVAGAVGIDRDPAAVRLARVNARRAGLSQRVQFELGDIRAAAAMAATLRAARPTIVVANPPYISRTAWASLAPSVRDWEAEHALVGADDVWGDQLPQAVVDAVLAHVAARRASDAMHCPPRFLMEISDRTQAERLVAYMNAQLAQQAYTGRIRPCIWTDPAGEGRCVVF